MASPPASAGRTGRRRTAALADASADALGPLVSGNVEPGTRVIADGWVGYNGLIGLGYAHEAGGPGLPGQLPWMISRLLPSGSRKENIGGAAPSHAHDLGIGVDPWARRLGMVALGVPGRQADASRHPGGNQRNRRDRSRVNAR